MKLRRKVERKNALIKLYHLKYPITHTHTHTHTHKGRELKRITNHADDDDDTNGGPIWRDWFGFFSSILRANVAALIVSFVCGRLGVGGCLDMWKKTKKQTRQKNKTKTKNNQKTKQNRTNQNKTTTTTAAATKPMIVFHSFILSFFTGKRTSLLLTQPSLHLVKIFDKVKFIILVHARNTNDTWWTRLERPNHKTESPELQILAVTWGLSRAMKGTD